MRLPPSQAVGVIRDLTLALSMNPLINANSGLIQQGIELLNRHTDHSYTESDPSRFGSSIGAHFRHVLDHYSSFLHGYETGTVNYDDRDRNTLVEGHRGAAMEEARKIQSQLQALGLIEDASVNVKVSASTEADCIATCSSLARELQFLVSHTVHHYALIAIASRMLGVDPCQGFGVAPSTLKYLQGVEA